MPARSSVNPHEATRTGGGGGGGVATGDHDGDEKYGAGGSGRTGRRTTRPTVLNPSEATRTGGSGGGGVATGDHDGDEQYGAGPNYGIVRSGSTGERTTRSNVLNPHEATRIGGSGGGGVATGDHDGDEKYGAGPSGRTGGSTTSRTVINPHEVTQSGVGGGDNNVKTGIVVEIDGGSGGSNVVTGDSTVQEETSSGVPSLQLVSDPQTWALQGFQPYTDEQGVTHVGSAYEGVERRFVGLGEDGGLREADAAVHRALQVFREQGATREQLATAEHHLRGAVGRGQDVQELANIARIRELTRGQVHVWDGSGYRKTDPNAVVTIGIDESGDIVGSTTSRPKPLSPHEREMQTIEQRIIAANEVGGRQPEPSAPAQDGIAAGGGYLPADTDGVLSVGGDLAPHVLNPGEARAMGKPELAGYTIETDADGQRFAVPPDSKRAESAVAEWNSDLGALAANPTADGLNALGQKWDKHRDADLVSLTVPVYGETDDRVWANPL